MKQPNNQALRAADIAVARRAFRVAYAPLRSAQHALDLIERMGKGEGCADACRKLAGEESRRIDSAIAGMSYLEGERETVPGDTTTDRHAEGRLAGLEEAAKVAEDLCADLTAEAGNEYVSSVARLHRASAQTACKLAAHLRAIAKAGQS